MEKLIHSSIISMLIEIHLQEYQALREEQVKRVEIASQIQLYAVVALVGMIPLIEYVESSAIENPNIRLLILFAALFFCTLGWYQLDLDERTSEIDNYLLNILTPKLKSLLSTSLETSGDNQISFEIFNWLLYWRNKRYKNFTGIWLGFGVAGRTGVALMSAFGLLAYYIISAHVHNSLQWTFLSIIATIAVFFGIIWMIISSFLITQKYKRVWKANINLYEIPEK